MTEGPYRESAKPKTKTWTQEVARVIYRWKTAADFEPLVIEYRYGHFQRVHELEDGRFLVVRNNYVPKVFTDFTTLETWLKANTGVSTALYNRWGPSKEEVWL